jgi:hypothetical protein
MPRTSNSILEVQRNFVMLALPPNSNIRAPSHDVENGRLVPHDEAFFSIDESGPFAIKAQPGRALVGPNEKKPGTAVAAIDGLFNSDGWRPRPDLRTAAIGGPSAVCDNTISS